VRSRGLPIIADGKHRRVTIENPMSKGDVVVIDDYSARLDALSRAIRCKKAIVETCVITPDHE